MKTDIFDRFPELKDIPHDRFPKHVLIIPDGNGRWAKKINSIPIIGHRQGFKVLRGVLRNLQELPIDTVTVWGFASDNWKRSEKEIKDLMNLFEEAIKEIIPDLIKNKSKFVHIGRKDRIPFFLKKSIEKAERVTRNNIGKTLCLAIDFGGEDQELRIMQAIQKLPQNTNIDAQLVKRLRDGQGEVPPADLIIRTSGENRTSDIGWLGTNSEFYSISKLLPDASMKDFSKALIDYSRRERRFGGRIK
ncbi:MAG: polyprenyl diphosphate synthase [Candidatus Levybacteria bacterium]|nr:polyprenyl diphosphate synthase [Candidatus Levybacteria bacterium]MDZ4228591.1 polyprenyl diphosphate synthase [Candidatus Levybacteria bacterium]